MSASRLSSARHLGRIMSGSSLDALLVPASSTPESIEPLEEAFPKRSGALDNQLELRARSRSFYKDSPLFLADGIAIKIDRGEGGVGGKDLAQGGSSCIADAIVAKIDRGEGGVGGKDLAQGGSSFIVDAIGTKID